MFCKICGEGNCEKISDIHHLVAYSLEEDMEGHFHYHDQNARWQEWKCSKGHNFKCAAFNNCWCGWTSQFKELNIYQFKPKKEVKGFKFSSQVFIINEQHTLNLKELNE